MNYITALTEHYLSLPVEKFTDKLISAFQIAEVGEFNKDDIKRLKFIESDTKNDINVSFYMLDRQINPEKIGFKKTSNKARFLTTKTNSMNERIPIVLPEEQIQKALCEAIREVSQIVMRNTKDFNMEFKRPSNNKHGPKIEF